jgi:hypothetical protein
MVEHCDDCLLRGFDANQKFLWLWNPSRGKSGGILVGVKKEFYDAGSFRQGDYISRLTSGIGIIELISGIYLFYMGLPMRKIKLNSYVS